MRKLFHRNHSSKKVTKRLNYASLSSKTAEKFDETLSRLKKSSDDKKQRERFERIYHLQQQLEKQKEELPHQQHLAELTKETN